ncbi:cytochrome c [Azovibrio restrictus]|uniref:c-type cytochrome n=1 Tax=Azovibrio restrictus TaxID=146938 RepID=UPI0026EEF249|nr:cytochrome c [Azovibrio restrictus]
MIKKLTLAAAALAVTGVAFAQQALKPEEAIKTRQAGYTYLGWSMSKIKANLEGTYNKDQVIAAANTIAAIANSGMGALYVPGSDKEVNGVKTRVKPEFFQKQQEVGKLAMAFNKEANELARVAATGDVAAVKAQFGKVGGTCKACHDDFRVKD